MFFNVCFLSLSKGRLIELNSLNLDGRLISWWNIQEGRAKEETGILNNKNYWSDPSSNLTYLQKDWKTKQNKTKENNKSSELVCLWSCHLEEQLPVLFALQNRPLWMFVLQRQLFFLFYWHMLKRFKFHSIKTKTKILFS